MPGVTAVVMSLPLSRTRIRVATTSERGDYTFDDLEPAAYQLSFFFADLTGRQTVDAGPGP
jgi:hypothetical protein